MDFSQNENNWGYHHRLRMGHRGLTSGHQLQRLLIRCVDMISAGRLKFYAFSLVLLLLAPYALAQNRGRVDLEDIQIQGELLSDDRIRLLSREKNSLADEIKVRTDFRSEILESLPSYFYREPAGP